MGFLGQVEVSGAGRRGTRRLAACVFLLSHLLEACNIEQPVSGPVALSTEWSTIEPPEPLRVGGKNEQKLCLQIATARDIDLTNGVVLGDGQRHQLEGEAILDGDPTSQGLQVGEIGGGSVCLYRAGQLGPGPDFPSDRTIVRLRLRAVPPLQVEKIWWLSYDPH